MSASATRRFKLTEAVPYEAELHKQVADTLDALLLPPAQWTTFPSGHIPLPGRWAVKLARLGLKRSWPDILVLHGRLYGIELKRRGGAGLSRTRFVRSLRGSLRIVEGQRDVFPRLEAAGMRIAVCESEGEVLAALAAWGVPLRNHVVMNAGPMHVSGVIA